MEKLHLDHEQCESMYKPYEDTHLPISVTEEEKEKFQADPQGYHKFRKTIETDGNAVHAISIRDSEFAEGARKLFTETMHQRLAKRPELADKLIPGFAVGCRRLTPGPGYLEALTEDNVDFISTGIRRITPTGVELEDGRLVELDVLVCATGFNIGAPPFSVVGMDQQTLQDRFKPYPEAYLSIAVDKFPNFFIGLGPNSGVGSGSLTKILESIGDYHIKCIRKLQREDIRAMHVKRSRLKDFSAYIDSYFQKTVYMDECKSWYRSEGGRGSRIVGLWPGSTLHAVETLRSPRWEDYEYIYDEGEEDDPIRANRLRWLGNGWSSIQLDGGDMSYYIEPEFVDFPPSPLPEKSKKWTTLSFAP